MGRTINISINSARDLRNADEDQGGQSDPYVIVCFDKNVEQELCRTRVASETLCPEWNETFDVDITKHIQTVVDETGEEPQKITFCVYDGDVTENEALGIAAVSFDELVKKGKVGGDLEVVDGTGIVNASVKMHKVKISSMLKDNAAVKIAGGVVGVAAVSALGAYMYKRYQTKKDKLAEEEGEDEPRTGIVYGANVDDDDDDEEDKDNLKKWWEMDDEEDEDEEENRWTGIAEAE